MPLWDIAGKEGDADVLDVVHVDAKKSSPNEVNIGRFEISTFEPIVEDLTSDAQEAQANDVELSNIPTECDVPPTPKTTIHKIHPLKNIIGDVQFGVKTRKQTQITDHHGFISEVYESKDHEEKNECMFL